MAQLSIVVHLVAGEPVPVDGLCPGCLLPALLAVPITAMCRHGVQQVRPLVVCITDDCSRGVK